MPKSPLSPIFFQQDAEPEIKSDIFGNIYLTAINGVPGGTDLWKSTDKGTTFSYLGQPDGLQDKCAAPTPQCLGAGGADDSIDVSSGGYLYVTSLYVGSVTVSTSMDGGTGGVQPAQAWNLNTFSTGIPVQDRQWVAAYGPQTLNMIVRQAPGTGDLTFIKSVDAGKTFSAPVIVRSGNSTEGNLVVDPYNGNLYTTTIPGTALTEIHLLKSVDGGATWTESTIYTGAAGTNPAHKFTMLAVDRGGNLHLAFSSSNLAGNCHVYLMSSSDQGASWLPAVQVDSGAGTTTAVQPWIVAGSPEVVDVTWLGSSGATPDVAPFDWNVFFAQTRNALSPTPTFTQAQVTSTPVHDTNICFNGTGCTGTANRDLLEYYTMTLDPDGNALIAFADSVNNCPAATCKTNAWFTRQTAGPSAYTIPSGVAATPATFAPNIAVGSPGAEPSLWVDTHNCIYVTAPGRPNIWKSVNNGASFLPPVTPAATGLTGGDEDIITIAQPDGSRPDFVYFTDLGISSDHIFKSTDGGATYFKPGTAGAAGETGVSSDRQWLGVDRIGPDQYVYEVDHEFTSEVIRLSTSVNDLPWTNQSGMLDPELATSVPNTNPGPVFVDKQTHTVYSVFNASIPTTNIANPPFGKLLNIWDFVAAAPAVAQGPPGPITNNPVFKGVVDSPTGAPPQGPPPAAKTFGTNNANIFPAGDIDSAGNIYVAWSMNNARTNEFSIWFAASHDHGKTFYGPFPVSTGPLAPDETSVLPWVAAGDNGRVDIVWYQSSNVADPNTMPAGSPWNVMFAQSLNGNAREPIFTVVQAGDHVMHKGSISTGGLIGSSDRSLLDYFEVNIGPDGLANIIYADNGATATHAEFARQSGGSLAKANPTFPTCLQSISIAPISAVSRKTHGSAGPFDIDLPLIGTPGIECRSGGATKDFKVIISFANPVTVNGTPDKARVTSGSGTVTNVTVNGALVTVDLTQVLDVQKITITLFSVSDGTQSGDVSVSMGMLLGDTNGDGSVSGADVTQTKAQAGNLAHGDPSANFREDVTVDGSISGADVTLVKRNAGNQLPP
ncbi:MAG: dockerin type I domain-containing protein [Chthoniobacterales bacterium]